MTFGSTRASELFFDLAVGGRLGRKLVEGCVEQAHGVFVSTLAPTDDAEVRDHLPLLLFVPELPEEDERLLEVLDRHGDTAGVNEGEGEIVERESFCSPVVQIAHDRQREAMVLGSLFVLPVTSKLRPELVESTRLTARVGCGWFPLTSLDDAAGLIRDPACEAV